MRVGWKRFRVAAVPITVLGVFGTFTTAALVALAGRYLFDFSWTGAGILGAALAPTDPAVMFSVLGKREVGGRTGTILEGESGVNDPVGIALMVGMIDFATHADATFWVVVREFALEMSIGLAVGIAGAWVVLAVDPPDQPREPGALSDPQPRRRRPDLRRRRGRARLGVPRGLRGRDPDRRRRVPAAARRRALPHLAREPRRGGRLRRARADGARGESRAGLAGRRS